MRFIRLWVIGLSFALIGSGILSAQNLSSSKISAHLINTYTAGSSNIIAGHPQVLKILDVGSDMINAIRAYKAATPNGKVVLRVYSPQTYTLQSNPDASAAATNFWTSILQPAVNSLAPSDRALIDYLEGPNEGQTPTLGYPPGSELQGSQWINQFWTNLTPLVVAAGFKPCIGSIAVGNPPGTTAQMQSYLAAFVPALRQAQAVGGAWSYHAYTIQYTTDVNVEFYYSLRYRQFYSYFTQSYPDLASMPMILSEGGVDQSGDPNTSGWQARGTADNYQRWLNWFDNQLRQDSYIVGCTLFENGNPGGWPSFDLEPISGWLGAYITNPTHVPPAPTGLSASLGNSTVTLTWTNVPVNPCSFNVKRSQTSGGPYTTIASNITTGITNYSYTDNTVTSGGTYYYVVSAVNAVGEGPNSGQAAPPAIVPSQINCGGPTVGSYIGDIYFSGGQTYTVPNAINTNGLANPAPMAVYQSQRYGNVTYTLPYLTPGASYKVRLHLAEIYWSSVGQRVFNVFINGAQVLTNFDIVAAAGSSFTGNIQSFNAISDSNGFITIQFVSVTDNASWNGLELIPNPTNVIPAAPTNLSATASTGQVSLVWTAPASATGFNVKRSTVSGGPYITVASNLTSPAFIDYSFTPGTTYYYVVTAKDALGESPNSNQAMATPTAGLPDLVITSISWSPNPAYGGNSVLFRATVKNQGSAPTPSGTVLGVGFGIDGGVSYPFSSTDTTALAPGSSVVLTANGGGSPGGYWPATPGPHNVTGNVDDVNRIQESNEGNNLLSTNFTIFTAGYAISCGGSAAGSFAADENFSGGSTNGTANAIDLTLASSAAAPQSVYQTERWGNFSYALTNLIPNQTYAVRLHFAEIDYTNVGQRVFNVNINGAQVLTNFDIIAQTGGQNKAFIKRFNTPADSNGNITIQYSPVTDSPKSSGIEVIATNAVANASPVLLPISNMVVNANSPISFTAMAIDPDQPLQTLTFSLVAGAPTGASIDPASGAFSWTPSLSQSPATNTIGVRVTDNGSPPLSASKTFTVIVVAPPRISQLTTSSNGNIALTFSAYPGKTYRVQYKNNLTDTNWTTLGSDTTAGSSSVSVPDNTAGSPHRFYRVLQLN